MSTDEITRLRAEITRLQRSVDHLEASTATDDRSRSSRRALLGGAVVAGGAALLGGRRAEAGDVNGEPVQLGETNTATETTEVRYPGDLTGAPRSHVFAAQDGVWGTLPNATSTPVSGTRAAVEGYCGNDAMHGVLGQTNTGLDGSSGGRFVGENALSYGVTTSGRRASLHLSIPEPWGTQPPPPTRFDAHAEGEITIDSNADVWLCVAAGHPGSWRKLGGPATAGAFHPIEPTRVFDSRRAGTGGIFGADTNRIISVKDGRDPASGNITRTDIVPPGSTAITYNVTVAQTVGVGYVYVAPGDATAITASTINWSSTGAVIANAGTVQLDGDRQLRVFCANNPAHVLIDITGYYR